MKSKSNKPLHFKEGGLHASLGVPKNKKIPEGKFEDALEGKMGHLAMKQAMFAKNVLKKHK